MHSDLNSGDPTLFAQKQTHTADQVSDGAKIDELIHL